MDFNDLNNIPNLQFMPVRENKQPIEKGWQTNKKKYALGNSKHVGLVCGMLSSENGAGLEVIDIDEKYSLDGNLFKNYKRLIGEINKDLLKKLVVQKTPSGGHHFIYRCQTIEGNLKLAQRYTTPQEKNET